MKETIIITRKVKKVDAVTWPYQVTKEEIVVQMAKIKKLSKKDYFAKMELMSYQQPALHAFLKSLPTWDWNGPVKSTTCILGLALWMAYKAKFPILPKVEDLNIGVDVATVFNTHLMNGLRRHYVGSLELWYLKCGLLPFTMMMNGLESAVTPNNRQYTIRESFRKRIWFNENHCFTKPATITAPPK